MVPFIVLVIATLVFRGIGAAGVALFHNWVWCLRAGLALMFLFTASAHWGKRRGDLVAMGASTSWPDSAKRCAPTFPEPALL